MKLTQICLFVCFCCWFHASSSFGQICIEEPFDTDTNIVYNTGPSTLKWRVVDLFPLNSLLPIIAWDADGAAETGSYWADRQPIQSPSGGGAFIFNPDDSLFFDIQRNSADFINAMLISPRFDLPAGGPPSPLFFSFYQYFRSYNFTDAAVDICVTGDCDEVSEDWINIHDNQYVGPGFETQNAQKIVLNLSNYLYDQNSQTWASFFRIRFRFVGAYYFWIIDDFKVCEENLYRPTTPPGLGDLLAPQHPYDIDDRGNPYVPNEVVIEFKPEIKEHERDSIRELMGVDAFVRCSCNLNLEQWKFNIDPDPGPGGVAALGDTIIQIQDVVKSSKPKSKLLGEELSYNYYTHGDFSKSSDHPFDPTAATPLAAVPLYVQERDSGEIVLAILDTGLDFSDRELAKHIWRNDNAPPYPGDVIGHNFVDDNNNVFDNNTHGDRTTRMITNQLPFLNCSYKVMVLKTHDADGFGTLFNNTCAMYYALRQGAAVVSTSFAWKGEPYGIFRRAIDSLGIVGKAHFVSAAGNQGQFLDTTSVYPAVFNLPNQTNVTSVAADSSLSSFSNTSNTLVKIGANGEDLYFDAYPGATFSGTSYAAPQVASALAALKYLYGEDVPATIARLNDCAFKIPGLVPFIEEGRVVNYNFPCLYPDSILGRLIYAVTSSNTLISFDSDAPAFIRSAVPIIGIPMPKKIAGIDFRTKSGELFALAYDASTGLARLYAIDLKTGFSAPVGTLDVLLNPNMGQLGFDMNPVSDQWKVTGEDGSNFRLSAIDGSLAATDANLTFAPGDVNAGKTPVIGSIAFDNNFEGAGSTRLYAYEDSLNLLLRLTNPANGQIQTIGQTTITLNPDDETADIDLVFDPNTGRNYGFLAANTRTATTDQLYQLDLDAGAAANIGPIGSNIAIRDIAVFLKEPETACEVKVVGCIRYEILRVSTNQQYERTYRIRITNNCSSPMHYAAFGLPKGLAAVAPLQNGVYAGVSGHSYETRNPSFSPFYSVRFKELGVGIQNGLADVFEYTLPPYAQPQYILASVQLADHANYETYLSIGACDGNPAAQRDDLPNARSNDSPNKISVLPNPSEGAILLQFEGAVEEMLQLRLLNTQGQVVWNTEVSVASGEIWLQLPEHLKNGAYIIEVFNQNGYLSSQRLMLQK